MISILHEAQERRVLSRLTFAAPPKYSSDHHPGPLLHVYPHCGLFGSHTYATTKAGYEISSRKEGWVTPSYVFASSRTLSRTDPFAVLTFDRFISIVLGKADVNGDRPWEEPYCHLGYRISPVVSRSVLPISVIVYVSHALAPT